MNFIILLFAVALSIACRVIRLTILGPSVGSALPPKTSMLNLHHGGALTEWEHGTNLGRGKNSKQRKAVIPILPLYSIQRATQKDGAPEPNRSTIPT